MKLLVFEYSCVCLKDTLLSEGYNMLKCILEDLSKSSDFEVFYLINKKLNEFKFDNLNPIYIDENLFDWLSVNSDNFDYCFFVAPENNLIQYRITKILEDNKINVLSSDSSSSYICSSKSLTYEKVPDTILKIGSIKLDNNILSYKNICSKFNNTAFILKPDNGTSSEFVHHVKKHDDFKRICENYEKNKIKNIIAQEYVKGTPISTSMFCNKDYIKCISINSQKIIQEKNNIKFIGCESPIKHPLEKKIIKNSERIIKEIPGLKGFIGIDYIIKDKDIYLVEINSRVTTPYIVLQQKCCQNLTLNIINSLINNQKLILNFKEKGEFYKEKKI